MGTWRSPCSESRRSSPSMRLGGGLGGQAAQLADHHQVLQAAQVRVEMRLFGHVAHALLVGDQVALNALAVEQDLAGGRLHQAGDHLHGGGLAGAVRPQVAGDLAGAGGKAHVIDGGDAEEAFGNVAQFEHGCYPM